MPSLPDWLSFLSYILWPIFVVLVVLMVFFTFTMLANVIAAPFNGFLAEKVEVVVRGTDDFPAFSWGELIAMIPRTLSREMRKLGWNEMLAWLREKRWQSMSFGGSVYLVLLIPVCLLYTSPSPRD